MTGALGRGRLTDEAYTFVRDAIMRGDLPTGSVLAEVDVARRLGISRTPVRHAFGLLLKEGLLEVGSRRQVIVRGEEVMLTQREFDVLLFLARHPGQVFSRNQLMDAVWQYSFYSDTSTVTVHIRRLRAKIEVDAARPEHIQTVWGVGYRFQP